MSKLYIVGTPIGNLEDMTYRAVRILSECDFIAAEDTRVTGKLLHRFEIQKPMVSYYAHNLRKRGQEIIARILAGEVCALVTDAGMPCISDPGEDLVRLAAAENIPIEVVPGPSAALSALAVSGLDTARFVFEGFLSVKRTSRFERLEALREESRTMIFYEAPHKLLYTLQDMLSVWGERKLSLCRELTKLHEQVLRTTLSAAVALYEQTPPRGEFVLVIEGAAPNTPQSANLDDALESLRILVEEEDTPLSYGAKIVAKETGFPKSELYKAYIEAYGAEDSHV